jgi:hypothetical protein
MDLNNGHYDSGRAPAPDASTDNAHLTLRGGAASQEPRTVRTRAGNWCVVDNGTHERAKLRGPGVRATAARWCEVSKGKHEMVVARMGRDGDGEEEEVVMKGGGARAGARACAMSHCKKSLGQHFPNRLAEPASRMMDDEGHLEKALEKRVKG